MQEDPVKAFIASEFKTDPTSRNYMYMVRKLAGRNTAVLFLFPFAFVFIGAIFAHYLLVLAGSAALYTGLIVLLIHSRYKLDKEYRQMSMSFRFFLFNSPISFSFLKYFIFGILVLSSIISLSYLPPTIFTGIIELVAFMGITSFLLLWSPYIRNLIRHSTELDSPGINARLSAMEREAGIHEVRARVIDGKTFGVANAFCVGVFRPKICITDLLLESVSEDEAVSLLAHELAHLKYRHVLKRILPTVVVLIAATATIIFLGMALSGFIRIRGIQAMMPIYIQVIVYAIIFSIVFPSALIRSRQENDADRFAVFHNGYVNLAIALLKARKLNLIPLAPFNGRRYSLILRLDRLKKYEMEKPH